MTADPMQRLEEEVNDLKREVRELRLKLAGYEQNGLQAARFKNLSQLYAAKDHTH